ncbi:MAG: hypothetical protein ABH828_00620 [archaeon]
MKTITIILGLILTLLLVSCVEQADTITTTESESTDSINVVEETTLDEPKQETIEGELGTIWLDAECEIGAPFTCEKYGVTDEKIRLIVSSENYVYVTKIYGDNCDELLIGKDFASGEEIEAELVCSDLETTNRKPLFIQFNYPGTEIQRYADVVMLY